MGGPAFNPGEGSDYTINVACERGEKRITLKTTSSSLSTKEKLEAVGGRKGSKTGRVSPKSRSNSSPRKRRCRASQFSGVRDHNIRGERKRVREASELKHRGKTSGEIPASTSTLLITKMNREGNPPHQQILEAYVRGEQITRLRSF